MPELGFDIYWCALAYYYLFLLFILLFSVNNCNVLVSLGTSLRQRYIGSLHIFSPGLFSPTLTMRAAHVTIMLEQAFGTCFGFKLSCLFLISTQKVCLPEPNDS